LTAGSSTGYALLILKSVVLVGIIAAEIGKTVPIERAIAIEKALLSLA
jgi:hypothetical protein